MLLTPAQAGLAIDATVALPELSSRTAMLLPTYNEDPHHLMARLRAMFESVAATGHGAQFDWFLLSDTTDPDIWIERGNGFHRVARACGAGRLFYRHRADNIARKSGNIAEWVRRFGAAYDHMIVLDADSLMTGDTIVRLVHAMEAHPAAALIQTAARHRQCAQPVQPAAAIRRPRLWPDGRCRQRLVARARKAIIGDTTPSFACAHSPTKRGLPELRGRKPFGGHILSHDFVEAALMRRAGWAIYMAPALGGSFEEVPPSLLDFAARDRRWCQGNLQHLAVLPARGLHWVSRLHLLTGIGCLYDRADVAASS